MSLFTQYEERPPDVQAVHIWYDTVDDIARYYSETGYETTVGRTKTGITLHLFHEAVEATEKRGAFPGCDLTVEVTGGGARQMLIYGHPPTLMEMTEFNRRYREAKELHP